MVRARQLLDEKTSEPAGLRDAHQPVRNIMSRTVSYQGIGLLDEVKLPVEGPPIGRKDWVH